MQPLQGFASKLTDIANAKDADKDSELIEDYLYLCSSRFLLQSHLKPTINKK